ncbi:MAG: hypothetical protein N3A01_02830 [Bacteroidales bacterium]|nr:hypothetical protein [Bacteroidales bacterium]
MIIIGAGGLGQETLGILIQNNYKNNIIFFDENENINNLYQKYTVIHNYNDLLEYLKFDNEFVVAIGSPRLREKIYKKVKSFGGKPVSVISKFSHIFQFNKLPEFCIIQPSVGISWGVEIGEGCVIHINSTIGHKSKIGNFVNIGPGVNIIGPCAIGNYVYIGAGSIILNGITIENNAIIPAGKVVTRDVKEFEVFEK